MATSIMESNRKTGLHIETPAEKPLIYTVASIIQVGKYDARFFLEIVDEHTLQVLEKRYPGRLTFDGCRTFTLNIVVPIKDMPERDPTMWGKLVKEHPNIVSAFVLERLRGKI